MVGLCLGVRMGRVMRREPVYAFDEKKRTAYYLLAFQGELPEPPWLKVPVMAPSSSEPSYF